MALIQAIPPTYRRDIDGLRALAVLVVVGFHAWPAGLPGGFVGVDVFFVISGFLITQIIVAQLNSGGFGLARFYLCRARRILPAYVLVVVVVSALALVVLLPAALQKFGLTLAASGLFLVNHYFVIQNGYFFPSAHEHLLLHQWSLAIEEQFYLLWPLALVGLWKLPGRRQGPVLAAVLLSSLALAQGLIVVGQPSLAFFLLPSRAWELLLGAALALGWAGRPATRLASEAGGVAGLALIVISAALFSDLTAFPGLWALLPCVGAAMVIWSGLGQVAPLATALLRTRAAVGVGLISYSLYLWHWPLLALGRIVAQRPLETPETLVLLALSLLLAAATWALVELPWRAGSKELAPRPRHAVLAGSALAALVMAGGATAAARGFPARTPPAALAQLDGLADMNPRQDDCFVPRGVAGAPAPGRCISGPADGQRYDVLLWGDSHADALAPGVSAWADGRGLRLRQASKGACPPLLDVRVRDEQRGRDRTCERFNRAMIDELAAHPEVRLVVLSARWPAYLDARPRYYLDPISLRLLDHAAADRPISLDRALGRTLDAIAAAAPAARVIILGPVPELPFILPQCLAQAGHLGRSDLSCRIVSAQTPLARAAEADAVIAAVVANRPFAAAVFPTRVLCDSAVCRTTDREGALYFDSNHLSASAARRWAPAWLDVAAPRPAP